MRKWKPFVKNSVSFHFPLLFILGANAHTSLCGDDTKHSRNNAAHWNENREGHFSLHWWEMERTLWFCCSAALFSSPHLFKAVRQQSGAINLNRSALPALLWLDVMISGCHSTHWYVSPCDPSASLFCHEQPGVYQWTHRRDPPTLHSLCTTSQFCVIILPPLHLFCPLCGFCGIRVSLTYVLK